MLSGWPIMMANTGVVLIVTADRLAASWAASIQDFAQYSLAASAMAVPTTAIAACSKVFFPHLARLEQDRRKRVYGISSWLLLIAWMILLPFYFALDIFVRHALPKYVPSLPYARILLLAVPFIAVIQILQMNYAYLNGIQRKFLAQTVVALVVSVGAMSFAVFHARSLGVLADTQVVVLGVWWLCNEWTLRSLTGQSDRDLAKFGGAYVLASLSYWITTAWTERTQVSVLAYYVGIAIVLMAFCREQLQLWARMVLRARAAQQLSATEGK